LSANFLGEIEHTTQTLKTITPTNFREETTFHTSFSPFLRFQTFVKIAGKTHNQNRNGRGKKSNISFIVRDVKGHNKKNLCFRRSSFWHVMLGT